MKAEVSAIGKVESGFAIPSEGWHVFRFEEGISLALDKETQEVKLTERGARCWVIPVVVDDNNDEDNGRKIFQRFYEDSKRNSDTLEMWLSATGLHKKFAAAFPNNEVFDDPVMSKVKVSLPNQLIKMKVRHKDSKGKDGKTYTNAEIEMWGPMSMSYEDIENAANNAAGSTAASSKKTASKPASVAEEW